MANKSEIRLPENLPIRMKMNPVAATSRDQRINHYEVCDSRRSRRRFKSKRAKPCYKDHK